jgi:F-type H+-transporting ATPase subunit delta
MADLKVAKRYAKSLIDLGNERGVSDKIFADMQLLLSVIQQSKPFAAMLRNPIIHNYKKMAVLKEVFSGKVDNMTLAFMDIVTRKGRENSLEEIARAYISQNNEGRGIRSAKVITAVPLDDQLRKQLLDIVVKQTGGTVEMTEQVDKNIIGGYILRWGDSQIDASVTKKLSQIKREFSGNAMIK